MNWFNQALRCLCLFYFMFLTACTDGIPLTPADNRGWIEVTEPTSERVYTTTVDSVELSGDAFIHPSDDPEKLEITWQNAAKNNQGTGVSNVGCIDLVTARGCFSDWTIALGQISLELGDNLITITAADDKGNRGTTSINVRRLAATALNLSSGTQLGASFSPLSLTDVNGDSELDVIALNLDAEDLVVVFLAGGDKGLRQSAIMNTISDPIKLTVSDINADELVDMIIANDVGETAFFTGNGDGTFDPVADLNLDDLPDVISVDPQSTQLVVNTGKEPFPLLTELNQAAQFAVSADINNDGALDLVTVNSGHVIGSISLFLGQGDGTYDPEQIFMFEK